MILPEDTKVPLSDDEDYADFDDEIDIEAGIPFTDAESVPFLPQPLHFPYPPPYLARPESEKPPTLRDRITQRLNDSNFRTRLILVFIILFASYWLSLPIRWGGRRGGYHGPGGPGGPPGRHAGIDGLKADSWKGDGRALDCAQFTPSETSPLAVDGTSLRSVNATFAIPLTAHEIFASLRTPSVRGVYVTSYVPAEQLTAPVESMITVEGDTNNDPKVLVTVEAMYQGDDAFKALGSARVCLMERNKTRHWGHGEHRRSGRSGRFFGVGVYPATGAAARKRDVAVQSPLEFRVHIALPINSTEPLDLRAWHKRDAKRSLGESLSNTVAAKRAASLIDAIMNVIQPHPSPPASLVPPIQIRAGEGEVHVGNLTGVAMAALMLDASVADVTVDHIRAEVVVLRTVGNIKADAAVSHFIDAMSPAGSIDLNVGTVRSPAYTFFKHQHDDDRKLPSPFKSLNASDPECGLPPVSINVRANNNHAVVRHSEWEVPCRTVSEHISSMVGSIDVYPHPVFEGAVRLSTTVGAISVQEDDAVDPTGAGRKRVVDLIKTSANGAKLYDGFVRWKDTAATRAEGDAEIEAEDPAESTEEAGTQADTPTRRALYNFDLDQREEADAPRDAEHSEDPRHRGGGHGGPPPPPWAQRDPGLTIETSVGSVTVVF